VHNAKIELFDVPVLRLIEVFNAHAYVVTAPACERRNGFFWGEFEIAHDRSPVLAAVHRVFKINTDVRYWHIADMGLCAAHVCF
jgi:tRNA(Phe) wybutosine-synthesizing methylase Tyw3